MTSERGLVDVVDVGKRFRYGPEAATTLKELAVRPRRRTRGREDFWALRNVTHRVEPGRTVGLVGRNGSGKSTLLRLIGGIGRPDEGRVLVGGRVGALLDLGKEFHPELTGRENAVLSAVVAGMTRAEARRVLPDVVDFAELGPFIDNPLRTYSSGMQARLAFATAVNVHPDVLLVDEVFAVGDLAFQQRCFERLAEFRGLGVTTLVVSHDMRLVRSLCDEVMWLRRGRLAAAGAPDEVVRTYVETTSSETEAITPTGPDELGHGGAVLRLGTNRFGSLAARVSGVIIRDEQGQPTDEVRSGAEVCVELTTSISPPVERCLVVVKVRRHDDVLCVDTSTDVAAPGRGHRVHIARLDVAPGDYVIDVGLFSPDWEDTYDLHLGAYRLRVSGERGDGALMAPPVGWS